jgi:hypothetical protein
MAHACQYRTVPDLEVQMMLSAVWRAGEKSPVRERFVTALRAEGTSRKKRMIG